MTYRQAIVLGEEELKKADIVDAKNDAWLLMAMACKIDHTYYYMHIDEEMTDEQMKDLALSYVDMISLICVKFAEYITYIDDEPEEETAEDRQAIELTIEALKFTLPHLNFSGVNAKMLRDHLHERGDGGCTLCDRYEPNWEEGEKYIRLYDLLNSHPLATNNTKWLYKWLKKTFPRRLRVDTGGWTG